MLPHTDLVRVRPRADALLDPLERFVIARSTVSFEDVDPFDEDDGWNAPTRSVVPPWDECTVGQ